METEIKIEKSNDYSLFKMIKGNRYIDPKHVKGIIGIYEKGVKLLKFNPIMVDPEFNIIDGQNRFEACKKLGIPIYFIRIPYHVPVEHIQMLNVNQKAWTLDQYLHSYVSQGIGVYIEFKRFIERQGFTAGKGLQFFPYFDNSKRFKAGRLVMNNAEKAERAAEIYHHLQGLGFEKTDVTPTISMRLAENKGYKKERMKSSVLSWKKSGKKLNLGGTQREKIFGLETIYNYRKSHYISLLNT